MQDHRNEGHRHQGLPATTAQPGQDPVTRPNADDASPKVSILVGKARHGVADAARTAGATVPGIDGAAGDGSGARRRPGPASGDEHLRASVHRVQRSAGNAAAAHLARSLSGSSAGSGPLAGVGSSATSGAEPTVQREVKSKEGILDGVVIKTFAHAAGFLASHVADLNRERAAVLGDGVPAPPELFNVAFAGNELLATVRGGGSADIDEVTYDQVDAWYLKWGPAMDAGEVARTLAAAQKVHDIKVTTADALARLTDFEEKVADAKAAAYRAEDDTLLGAIWNWGTALADSALDATPLLESATDMERELIVAARAAAAQAGPNVGKVGASYKMPAADKILPMVNLANKAVNAFQAVQGAAALVSAGKSASAKAKSDIKATVQIAGSVEGFLGVATGIGIVINLYITPMTDACLTALDGLENVARKVNRMNMEQGLYDVVNWDLEPGKPNGRALFMFMLAVRNASDPSGVPQPVPKLVADYLVDNKDDLEKGSGVSDEKDEMPTTGMWFWKGADQAKLPRWVFAHRDDLWAMFYGSLKPNSAG